MNAPRTSLTHPLRIDSITLPGNAMLGLSLCPGKKQVNGMTGAWERDLPTDIRAIREWGGNMVITLLEPHELHELKVANLGQEVTAQGMKWLHQPIANDTVPGKAFLHNWQKNRQTVHEILDGGGKAFIHCMGGIGRTSTLAGMILVERGVAPEEAIKIVNSARERSFYMGEQSAFISSYRTKLHNHDAGKNIV